MSAIERRHFLYGAVAVAAGVMGTGCTPEDARGSASAERPPRALRCALLGNRQRTARIEPALLDERGRRHTNFSRDVLVVNRSPDVDLKSRVDPGSFRHTGTVKKSHATAKGDSLNWTFAAHSVTLLRFPPESN
ncbi:twin-arginine translocation signal domain-containing protein [Streptomyces javensis]|uniref:twin-arginine translocation signal domain-containing protein n=1 Tax=Streptomyces javensis TaxID=114698 RepID=UPI0033FFF1E3